jgi:hypothetical protein
MQSTHQCTVTADAICFEAVDVMGEVLDSVSIGRTLDAGTIVLASSEGDTVELRGLKGPTGPHSAVNKQYVDALVSGIRWLDPVTVATATQWELSALLPNTLVGDYTLEVDDRVLLRGQTDAVQNGVYVVRSAGPVRAADLDLNASAAGAAVFVQVGQFASCGFVCSVADPDTAIVGTNSLAFVQFTGLGQFTEGPGIDLSRNTISIKAQGIVTNLIQDAAVTGVKLAEESVAASKLALNAVTSDKILDAAVTTAKIQNAAIDGSKIGPLAVDTSHLVNNAVDEFKLGSNSVTGAKIATNAVTSDKILNGAVGTAKIENGAVTNEKILNGSVDESKLDSSSVTTIKIAINAVTSDKIVNDAVSTTKIQNAAIDGSKIGLLAVGTSHLVNNAVDASKLGTDAVIAIKIAANAVTSEKIVNGAVGTAKIENGAVTNEKILNGSVDEFKLGSNSVKAVKIAINAVTSDKIIDSAVTASKIAKDAVTQDAILDGAVGQSKIENGAVLEAKLGLGSVTNGKLANLSVSTGKIQDVSVTTVKLSDNAVTTSKIQQGSVTGEKLSSTIEGAKKFADHMTCEGTVFAKKFQVTSDASLKEHVTPIESASDIIQSLRPVSYRFKDFTDTQFGLIAQEVQLHLPQVVHQGDTLSIDYTSVFVMLLKSHQELVARITQLESIISTPP